MKKIIGIIPLLFACQSEDTLSKVATKMWVTPLLHDLGDVYLGQEKTAITEVESLQGEDLVISEIQLTNLTGESCSYNGDPEVTIPVTELHELPITYYPEEEGYHQCELSFQSNAIEAGEIIVVRAHGITPEANRWPDVVDFGRVLLDAPAEENITIQNQSGMDFNLTGVSTTSGEFSITTPLPLYIASGTDVQIAVQFAPTEEDTAVTSSLSFTFAEMVELQPVSLRANDCENGEPALYDLDMDGFTSCAGDCDDSNADISPTGIELCDQLDNDCDGVVDENTECFDDDGDGFSELEDDCNDQDPLVYPGAEEIDENGIDDDCNGVIDLGAIDLDGDGYTVEAGDCDDDDADVYPNAPELPDGVDNDCNNTIDEGTSNYDDDTDGYAEVDGDCNDNDPDTYPNAVELPDWRDNDCDGTTDEGTVNYDDDGDGYSEIGGDTDDTDPNIHP